MKPIEIETMKIASTRINDFEVTYLEVDMKHVNYGLDSSKNYRKDRRSNLTLKEVALFFESLDGLELESESEGSYDYFVVDKKYDMKKFRIVFCIERLNPAKCGVITMFQIMEE